MEGISRFTFEIMKRVTADNKEHTFLFFFDRPFDPQFVFSDNVIPVVLFPPARHPVLWYWYFEFAIPRALKKYNADLFISTDGWISLRTPVKTIQVLHDLHFVNSPESLPFLTKKYYQHFFPKFIRKANRIVTVSEFSRGEISRTYEIQENNLDVVPNSSRDEYRPLSIEEISEIQKKYSKGCPYFLFIGPIHPRKNPEKIIEAFLKYKERTGGVEKLIITGSAMWRNFGAINKSLLANSESEIIFTGYLPDDELFKVTAGSYCLLYISLYEGFGIPILEAQSCGVPVITSDCSAMPEVAGGAAILVNPAEADSITEAMIKIKNDPDLQNELIRKGKSNLQRYSWDNSSKKFWTIIEKMLN